MVDRSGGPGGFRRGIDEATLKQVADLTGGTYYPAESADQLQGVFESLPTSLITKHEVVEVGVGFVGAWRGPCGRGHAPRQGVAASALTRLTSSWARQLPR